MVLAQQSFQLLKSFFILAATFALGWYLFSDRDYHHSYEIAVKGKKGIFVEKALRTDIDGPYDNSTLIRFCARKEWREGLIFQCEPAHGGVANIRNIVLNCIRYALEAGGRFTSSFLLPFAKVNSLSDGNYHARSQTLDTSSR
jgi:hypothetical protein